MKRSLKVVSIFLIISLLFTMCAYASTIKGGGSGTGSDFYWYENFNDATVPDSIYVPTTQTDLTVTASGSALVVSNSNSSNTASNCFLVKGGAPFDFSKGDLVISYDMILGGAKHKVRGEIVPEDQTKIIAGAAYANGTNLQGYICDVSENATYTNKNGTSTITPAANTTYNVELHLSYNSTNDSLDMKQYINGQPFIRSYTGKQFVYTNKTLSTGMGTELAKNWALRFYVYGGATVTFDNIVMRTEGNVDLPDTSWLYSNSAGTAYNAGVTFTDSAKYLDENGEAVSFSYPKASNNLIVANPSSQITLKKYNYANDPLLLGGEEVSSPYISWRGASGITVSGLSVSDAANDFYVLKLNDLNDVTNFAGNPAQNKYVILHRGLSTIPVIRESALYSGDEQISLEDGKLPTTADKLEITVANSAEITASNVTFSGNGDTVKATQDGKTFTLNLPELAEGTKYTVTVGDTVVELTTTGTAASAGAFGYVEKFDSGLGDLTKTNGNITLTALDDGTVQYQNETMSNYSSAWIDTGKAFDFTKGSLYVGFDVELNQSIGYISDRSQSHFLYPQIKIGDSKTVGFTPFIEENGVKYMNSSGSRVGYTKYYSSSSSIPKGSKFTFGALIKYYPDENKIGYVQLVNGEVAGTGADAEKYIDVSGLDLTQNVKLYLSGRNLSDGGVIIDNVVATTVDKITADDTIVLNGTNATINIKNSVEFEEGADELITQLLYTNSLAKSDVKVTKYASTDKLLLNGTAVTDFLFDSESLTVSNLQTSSDDVFVIEIDNTKLTSYSGEAVDKKYFKAAASAPQGLIKTAVYDASGNEMYCEDGLVSTAAAKIAFTFADGYVTSGVALGSTDAVFENGAYVVTLSYPLAAKSNYTLKVDGSDYGTFTTTDGAISVSVPTIGDDSKASVVITNTTSKSVDVYLLNAAFNADNELADFVYDKITVATGTTVNFTSEKAVDTTGASTQKAFVWDGFEKLTPYNDFVEKTLN